MLRLLLFLLLRPVVNVRDMNVIFPGLRPAPINRWTVTPYCSHCIVIARASLTFSPSIKPKVTMKYKYCEHLLMFMKWNKNVNNLLLYCHYLHSSYVFSCFFIYTYLITKMMKVRTLWPSSEDQYIQREIMFRRTKVFNY